MPMIPATTTRITPAAAPCIACCKVSSVNRSGASLSTTTSGATVPAIPIATVPSSNHQIVGVATALPASARSSSLIAAPLSAERALVR